MNFKLAPLPYAQNALEPYISAKTLKYHYGKHHAGYVKKLNKAVEADDDLRANSLLEIIRTGSGSVFNNAAQVWNHTFYWHSMCPASQSGEPSPALHQAMGEAFGSMEEFKMQFKKSATSNFASGWTWLVMTESTGALDIVNTDDAGTPLTLKGVRPLLTLDVWEHAYYLDQQNKRGAYIDAFWSVTNWDFVSENFSRSDNIFSVAD